MHGRNGTAAARITEQVMMAESTTILLDNMALFSHGQHRLQVLSWQRETLERSFAGLDGVVSLDLGRRERRLKQRGYLSAESIVALTRLIEDISAYIDGQSHDLVDQYGIFYGNVRMDSFCLLEPMIAANQTRCGYEIIYTQLSA